MWRRCYVPLPHHVRRDVLDYWSFVYMPDSDDKANGSEQTQRQDEHYLCPVEFLHQQARWPAKLTEAERRVVTQ